MAKEELFKMNNKIITSNFSLKRNELILYIAILEKASRQIEYIKSNNIPYDTTYVSVRLSIQELKQIVKNKNTQSMKSLVGFVDSFMDKKLSYLDITDGKKKDIATRLVSDRIIHDDTQEVEVLISPNVSAFFFDHSTNAGFTFLKMYDMSRMSGINTIRMYMYLRRFCNEPGKTIHTTPDQLRSMLGYVGNEKLQTVDKYVDWGNFRPAVIDRALNELQDLGIMNVRCSITKKDGKTVTGIAFTTLACESYKEILIKMKAKQITQQTLEIERTSESIRTTIEDYDTYLQSQEPRYAM